MAALSASSYVPVDLDRSKAGDHPRIGVRAQIQDEVVRRAWASSLVGSVRSLRLRSDETRNSTSNGVHRSSAIKHSTRISPPERTKGIEPTASHSLAWPIIVSYAFLSIHLKVSKFLLTTTLIGGSTKTKPVGGATLLPGPRTLRTVVMLDLAWLAWDSTGRGRDKEHTSRTSNQQPTNKI